MANINEIEKDIHTNTFWVNPTKYDPETGEVVKEPDELGVSFPEPSYKDGIEIPDKLVTINGAINYRLLDAINLNWDGAKIPWAEKITKWAETLMPVEGQTNYKYNEPNEGGWTDGTIKETEDVVDILNYLIYRVVAFDYFMDHWNDMNLQSPALRLVNHRTDWYPEDFDPDAVDGDKSTEDVDTTSDGRLTVKSSGLIINLYPYLVSKVWENPDTTFLESYVTKLYDSTGVRNPEGVLMSDTGWTIQRDKIYCGTDYRKIVAGGENFDIFDAETASTSTHITFISKNPHMIDGFVQNSINVSFDDGTMFGGRTEISTVIKRTGEDVERQTNYLFKIPVVAYKCLDTATYPYTTLDVLKTLLRYNYVGVQDPNYRGIYNTTLTPQFDPSSANATFGVYIEKTQTANGYAAGSKLFNVTIYKGDNTLYDFKVDKSIQEVNTQGECIFYEPFRDSHNNIVNVKKYKTNLAAPDFESDYTRPEIADYAKTKITFEAEFGPTYDSQYYGDDAEKYKKSCVYPYFIVKNADDSSDYPDVINSIDVNNYDTIYRDTFRNSDSNESSKLELFVSTKYGKITYEKSDNKWNYFYYPPAKENITFDANGDFNIKLCALMYYPINDTTMNRLLNPLWAELQITIKEAMNVGQPLNFNTLSSQLDGYMQLAQNQELVINEDYILTDATIVEQDGENWLRNI